MGNLLQACTDPKGEAHKRSALEGGDAESRGYNRDSVDGHTDPSSHEANASNHLGDDKYNIHNVQINNPISQQQQQQNEKEEAERQRLLREEQARLKLIVSTAGRDMVSIHPNKSLSIGNTVGGMNNHSQGIGISGGRQVGYYDPAYAAAEAQDLLQSGGGGGGLHALFLEMEMKESSLLQGEDEAKRRGEIVPSDKRSMISMVAGRVPPTSLVDAPSVIEALSKKHVWTKASSHHHEMEASEMIKSLGNLRKELQLDGTKPAESTVGGNLDFFLDDCAEKCLGSILPNKESLFQGLGPIVENLP